MPPFPFSPVSLISIIVGCALGLGLLYFAWVSHQEEEPRAARRALALALLLPAPYLTVSLIAEPWQTVVGGLLLGLTRLGGGCAVAAPRQSFPGGGRHAHPAH